MKNKKFNIGVFIICLLIVFLVVGGLGSVFTSSNTNTDWYDSIKPSITPPSIVFPIVWNLLFLLITFSLYFAWTGSKNKNERKKVALVFGINLILNALWSFLFFGLQNPLYGMIDLVLIWLTIGWMIFTTWKINKLSSYLLIPYFVWVSFAGVLNYLAI